MSASIEEESVTTIDVYTGCASLGVSIVGGIDTPLVTAPSVTITSNPQMCITSITTVSYTHLTLPTKRIV